MFEPAAFPRACAYCDYSDKDLGMGNRTSLILHACDAKVKQITDLTPLRSLPQSDLCCLKGSIGARLASTRALALDLMPRNRLNYR